MIDSRESGRRGGQAAYGERKASAKLTDAKVRRIRADCPRVSYTELGKEYGVHRTTIRAAALGMLWKHLNDG